MMSIGKNELIVGYITCVIISQSNVTKMVGIYVFNDECFSAVKIIGIDESLNFSYYLVYNVSSVAERTLISWVIFI